jgi:hypothetical protein
MTQLRLFMLRHGKGGAPVLDSTGKQRTFPDKPSAKAARDLLGDGVVVSRGPDHKLYNK